MAGRLPVVISAATAVSFILSGSVGYARMEYHVVASGAVGASDNPRSQPDQSSNQADGFMAAEGQFDLRNAGRRTTERLGYSITATSWFREIENPYVTQTLGLASEIKLGPETSLTLSGGATLTRLSMVDTSSLSDSQTGLRPAGNQYFLGIDASESLASQLSAAWRVDQALEGHWYRPWGDALTSAGNKSASLRGALNHTWTRDWAGLQTRVGVATQDEQAITSNSTSEFGELALSWQHEWTPDLRHTVAAGIAFLHVEEWHPMPAGSASLLWNKNGRNAELRASTGASANYYTGVAYQQSSVGLRVGLPIDRLERFRLAASADLERGRTLASSTTQESAAEVAFLRASAAWAASETLALSLQYTFRYQRAVTTESGTDSGAGAFPTLRQQTIMLSVQVQYPPPR